MTDPWPVELLQAYLENQKGGFISLLEQHPEGTVPSDPGSEDITTTPSPGA
jgi:hypothetical protein